MKKKIRLISLLGWLLSLIIFFGLLFLSAKGNAFVSTNKAVLWIVLGDIGFGILSFVILIISIANSVNKVDKKYTAPQHIPSSPSFLYKSHSPWFLIGIFVLILIYAFQVVRTNSLFLGFKTSITPAPTPILVVCNTLGRFTEVTQEQCDEFNNVPRVVSTQTPTIIPTKTTYIPTNNNTSKIDCVGPDGKHMQITYQECVNFNNAWKGIKTETSADPNAWGVASQVSEHLWTIKLGCDSVMATPKEIYDALNNYRNVHGKGTLGWNDKLAAFAQSRAEE